MESSSHRAWHEAHKRSVGCPSVSLPDHSLYSCLLLFSLCAPASTCTVKEAGSLFFFLRLNGEAVGKVCSYGESWRGNECLSQHLFAGLFHASQPGSVINPEYPAFPADPSPHRAAAVHWHASQTADYQQWVWKWCTHQSWKCIQMLSVSLFFFFYFFHLYFLSCSDLIQHFW